MYKFILTIFFVFALLNCADKTIYSGKILNQDNFNNLNFKNKNGLIKKFGYPSYIDPISNKYFYFSKKEKKRSIFDKNVDFSLLFVFQFNEYDIIQNSKVYDLSNTNQFKSIEEITENEIVKRGLLEKIFGGVGPQQEIPQ